MHIPEPAEDKVDLSEGDSVDLKLALQTAAKVQELASLGMGGALPVMISAALLRSSWRGDSPPSLPVAPQQDDPNLRETLPEGFVEKERARLTAVADKLADVGGRHEIEFCINNSDPPASANGGQVWMNIPLTAQIFNSDDLLAFALAHEKGHLSNGDLSWEPRGTELLWNVMTNAYDTAEKNGDSNSAAALDAGITTLQESFNANAQINEIDADLAAVSMVDAAGFDRKPGLAFLLTTTGDIHHPPGKDRVQAIRQHLQNTDGAISDQEMAEIIEMARGIKKKPSDAGFL